MNTSGPLRLPSPYPLFFNGYLVSKGPGPPHSEWVAILSKACEREPALLFHTMHFSGTVCTNLDQAFVFLRWGAHPTQILMEARLFDFVWLIIGSTDTNDAQFGHCRKPLTIIMESKTSSLHRKR